MPEEFTGQENAGLDGNLPAGDQGHNPELEAQGEDGQPPRQAQPQQRMVPLSEHVAQRKKHHAQLRERDQRLEELMGRLERLEQGGGRRGEEVDPRQKQWKDYTGVSQLEEKIRVLEEALAKKGGVDPELEARLARAEQAANLAADRHMADMEAEAKRAYNPKEIPIPFEAWERLVCGVMSPEESFHIANGDGALMQTVIKRAKAYFRAGGAPNNQPPRNPSNGRFDRRPPAAPGPGGSPAPAPAPERLTGRKLHERAHAVLSAFGAER